MVGVAVHRVDGPLGLIDVEVKGGQVRLHCDNAVFAAVKIAVDRACEIEGIGGTVRKGHVDSAHVRLARKEQVDVAHPVFVYSIAVDVVTNSRVVVGFDN